MCVKDGAQYPGSGSVIRTRGVIAHTPAPAPTSGPTPTSVPVPAPAPAPVLSLFLGNKVSRKCNVMHQSTTVTLSQLKKKRKGKRYNQ